MRRLLTLTSPTAQGEVTWDEDAGVFIGTDADMLNLSVDSVPWHPGMPQVQETPRQSLKAVIVLLHVWGWDVPTELADEARAMFAGQTAIPADAVA